MSFLDLFRKKPSHEEKLSKAYTSIEEESMDEIFHDGLIQANTIIMSISTILNRDLSTATSKEYFDYLSMFYDVIYRKNVLKEMKSSILIHLIFKYSIQDCDDAQRIFSFSYKNFLNPKYSVNSDKDFIELDDYYNNDIYETFRDIIFKKQETDSDKFGYSKENPLCTFSIHESNSILSKLLTENGEKLYWLRVGCSVVQVDTIDVIVDEYQLYLLGEKYTKLYICPYSYNSNILPKGLKLNALEDPFQNLSYDAKTKGITVEELLEIHKL